MLLTVLRIWERLVNRPLERAYGRLALSRVGSVGTDVRVHGKVTFTSPDRLTIGDYTRIGRGAFFFCDGGVAIGVNCQISRNVVIYSGNHRIRGTAVPYDDSYDLKPVVIGDSVWIGMNAAILPGVTVGDGAVIGFGTVVTKDVPPGAVVVGAAQRVVTTRDMDAFAALTKEARLFGRVWPDA